MAASDHYDVLILGGGLAGLTLAIQLKRARPRTSILVAEKSEHPVMEAAHKVGESTVEIGAHYFGRVVGMKEHIEKEQLPKLALRYFFPADGNTDITQRVEVGVSEFPPVPSYQLDRGRFENALGREAKRLGVDFVDQTRVEQVSLGAETHTIHLRRDDSDRTVSGRWVVDASGRAAILKRQLGLAEKNEHNTNASWFRIGERIDVDLWSDDEAWHARVPERTRRFSTNHLMGNGYWVWLIPLASGSHSVGIVADPTLHPFDEMNTMERALAFLRKHEPQLAAVIEARRDKVQDFRVLKHYSYGCQQLYSPERWCLTGEAGVFPDPLYSPGSDMIAISNTFISDMIVRELDGEDIADRLEFFNTLLLTVYNTILAAFQNLYPMFGNARVFTAKTCWDSTIYWGFLTLAFLNDKFTDVDALVSGIGIFEQMGELHRRMQDFFRDWAAVDQGAWRDAWIDLPNVQFTRSVYEDLMEKLDDTTMMAKLNQNLRLIEALAVELFRKVAPLVGTVPEGVNIDPYKLSLDPERWEQDGVFKGSPIALDNPTINIPADLDFIWLEKAVKA